MMLGMIHSPGHRQLDTARGYEREVPAGEAILFGTLLGLPVALLLLVALLGG
jgi:hypothetical protein